jgi:ABC-2 type transport system ATP-binding protein
MANDATIELDGLNKSFGRAGRRRHHRGGAASEVTAFLGPNGAGKTTTLRMLLGLVSDGRHCDDWAGGTTAARSV